MDEDRNRRREETPPPQPDATRRRLTSAGLAVPVLLSVAARPAWGNRCTVSARLSGNQSVPQTQCEGCTPGFWKQHPEKWPSSYDPGSCTKTPLDSCKADDWSGGTRFHDVFDGAVFGELSLMQVLHLQGNEDPHQAGAHTVAALLNATVLEHYGYEPQDVIELWNSNYAGNREALKETLALLNESYCPL